MNKIETKNKTPKKTNLKEVISSGETAFIGKCGEGDHALYLICYQTIVQADEPYSTWSNFDCPVIVDYYCDTEIKEIG